MPIDDSTPPFASTLPPEFLEGLDARGVFLYKSADEARQALKWLVEKRHETDARLDFIQRDLSEVKAQTTKTNGRTTVTEAKVAAIETDQGLHFARVGAVLVRSKLFWGGIAVFVLVGLPLVVTNAPVVIAFLKALIA